MAGCSPRIPTPHAPCPTARVVSPLVITSPHVVSIAHDTRNRVAVGMALSGHPPHGSVREALPHTALTSGTWRRSACAPLAHAAGRSTRLPGSVSGAWPSAACSPWSDPFPPPPPPTVLLPRTRLCSGTSSVLRVCPTSHERACRTSRSVLSPADPAVPRRRVFAGPPGSRAWSVHACSGSSTPWGQWATRVYRHPSCCLPHQSTRSAPQNGDFGAQWLACVFPCQRLTCDLTAARA